MIVFTTGVVRIVLHTGPIKLHATHPALPPIFLTHADPSFLHMRLHLLLKKKGALLHNPEHPS